MENPKPPAPVFSTPEEALASLGPLRERIASATDKTPSTVVQAFVPDPVNVSGIVLPPINIRTWLRLEKINSPFLRADVTELTMEDVMKTFYVIAMPAQEVGAAIAGGDVALAAAVDEFSSLVPLSALPTLSEMIATHLAKEFEPKANMVHTEEGSGTGPKPKASLATEQAQS